MAEGLFVLTIIFVAYVVYVTVNESTTANGPKDSVAKTASEPPKELTDNAMPKAITTHEQPAPSKPTVSKKATTITKSLVKKGLRDPKTGEVATSYSNYRFTKRWIKDALVAEGLLDKVYKNNELDVAIEAVIKEALVKLEAIDKYKA